MEFSIIKLYNCEKELLWKFIERGECGFYEDELREFVERTKGKPSIDDNRFHCDTNFNTRTEAERCLKLITGEMGRRNYSTKQIELISHPAETEIHDEQEEIQKEEIL